MLIGARSGGRTRIPFRMRDFKSLAYTNFAIRAERCSWPPRWIAAAQDYNQLPGFTQPHRSCIGGGLPGWYASYEADCVCHASNKKPRKR